MLLVILCGWPLLAHVSAEGGFAACEHDDTCEPPLAVGATGLLQSKQHTGRVEMEDGVRLRKSSEPMAWEFVRSAASGRKPQPHCHYSKYSEVCNAANNGKVYYGNQWDVVGGDVTSAGSCDGGWHYHGYKSVDRKFTCQMVPAPAPTPAPQYEFVHSSASGTQPQPHCHLSAYSPVCNAENEGKSYFANYADAVGANAQELGECTGHGWYNHGPKPVDSRFTCTFVGGTTEAPSDAPTDAPTDGPTDAPTDAPSPEGTFAPGPSGPEGPLGPPGPPGFQGPPGPPR